MSRFFPPFKYNDKFLLNFEYIRRSLESKVREGSLDMSSLMKMYTDRRVDSVRQLQERLKHLDLEDGTKGFFEKLRMQMQASDTRKDASKDGYEKQVIAMLIDAIARWTSIEQLEVEPVASNTNTI